MAILPIPKRIRGYVSNQILAPQRRAQLGTDGVQVFQIVYRINAAPGMLGQFV
jgi:hypothetical protein